MAFRRDLPPIGTHCVTQLPSCFHRRPRLSSTSQFASDGRQRRQIPRLDTAVDRLHGVSPIHPAQAPPSSCYTSGAPSSRAGITTTVSRTICCLATARLPRRRREPGTRVAPLWPEPAAPITITASASAADVTWCRRRHLRHGVTRSRWKRRSRAASAVAAKSATPLTHPYHYERLSRVIRGSTAGWSLRCRSTVRPAHHWRRRPR
jgi:hypothetical protein